jgi:hypothetical protein
MDYLAQVSIFNSLTALLLILGADSSHGSGRSPDGAKRNPGRFLVSLL